LSILTVPKASAATENLAVMVLTQKNFRVKRMIFWIFPVANGILGKTEPLRVIGQCG